MAIEPSAATSATPQSSPVAAQKTGGCMGRGCGCSCLGCLGVVALVALLRPIQRDATDPYELIADCIDAVTPGTRRHPAGAGHLAHVGR